MIRLAAILAMTLASAPAWAADPPEDLRAGEPFPPLDWRTPSAEVDSMATHQGRWLLLKIGVDWCALCVAEFDEVSTMRAEIVKAGKVDFTIVSWRLPAMPEEHFQALERQLRQAHHSTMPVPGLDLPQRFRSSLRVPYAALIDPHGRIVAAWVAKVGLNGPETDADWADRTRRVLADQNLIVATQ